MKHIFSFAFYPVFTASPAQETVPVTPDKWNLFGGKTEEIVDRRTGHCISAIMKRFCLLFLMSLLTPAGIAGNVEKTYAFSNYKITYNGAYQSIRFDQTLLSGLTGEPMLPYCQVALLLPPGEKAVSVQISGEELTPIPGSFQLFPQQAVQPLSVKPDGIFRKNDAVYRMNASYPGNPSGRLIPAFLNGYSFALTTFTPMIYNPAGGSVSFFKKVTVRVATVPDNYAKEVIKNIPSSFNALRRIRLFAQNRSMMDRYPLKKGSQPGYEILIITPEQYQDGFFDLVNLYNGENRPTRIAAIEMIATEMTGQDLQEKIRNYIIREYQANGIDQVILGGDAELVPYRGFYCHVQSGPGYEDVNIPADIYYSALDGNWNSNGNIRWGEPGEEDLLPEISVGRMPFGSAAEQSNLVHKSIVYQSNMFEGDRSNILLVSEKLYDEPITWGSDYLELLVDDHQDNGYSTHGIPAAFNHITRLYDSTGFFWSTPVLLDKINSGQSFIHHSGHASTLNLMRLGSFDMTNWNFTKVDGIVHNYQLMYSNGCDCGAYDVNDCIAERAVNIANWLAAGIFNSRYGWFNQGSTEGPSAHLHREFISALYHPDPDSAITELGAAHTMSKIRTAPWIGLPNEFEPGAQLWCHYGSNVLGDPAMKIRTSTSLAGVVNDHVNPDFTLSPVPASGEVILRYSSPDESRCLVSLLDPAGRQILSPASYDCQPGTNMVRLRLDGIPSGFYFCVLQSGMSQVARKLVVVR